ALAELRTGHGCSQRGLSPRTRQAHRLTGGRRAVSLVGRGRARRNRWPAAGMGCVGRKLITCSARSSRRRASKPVGVQAVPGGILRGGGHGSDYYRQSGLQQAMAEEQLGHLTLEGGERILDIGCGDGKITAEIAARVPRGSALGVDPSQNMIAFASSRFGPPAQANLRFEEADARRLPYRDEFDLVVSFNALHWVPEQDAALGSIRAALKPGGRALLRLVPSGRRECLEDVIEEVRQRPRWTGSFVGFRRPYVHFTPEEYR